MKFRVILKHAFSSRPHIIQSPTSAVYDIYTYVLSSKTPLPSPTSHTRTPPPPHTPYSSPSLYPTTSPLYKLFSALNLSHASFNKLNTVPQSILCSVVASFGIYYHISPHAPLSPSTSNEGIPYPDVLSQFPSYTQPSPSPVSPTVPP